MEAEILLTITSSVFLGYILYLRVTLTEIRKAFIDYAKKYHPDWEAMTKAECDCDYRCPNCSEEATKIK